MFDNIWNTLKDIMSSEFLVFITLNKTCAEISFLLEWEYMEINYHLLLDVSPSKHSEQNQIIPISKIKATILLPPHLY